MKTTPWYKQFWPWFLIILPMCAVVASLYTVYIAVVYGDSVVAADYYKKGKGINLDLSKVEKARELGYQFELQQTADGLLLRQHSKDTYFGALNISFTHATLPELDSQWLVTADGNGNYLINKDVAKGKWEMEINEPTGQWKLYSKIILPINQSIEIK
ncbi:FixH family protein [Paraferrimonas sp. SM1919]|uniref:FixH family protein n=1 Tax=Paraferrimonas sp. SM1919 TaxID=2662263 RepID=UPI001F09622E|nr:FixH family protein [Paraferrimonas sp. SM1919]